MRTYSFTIACVALFTGIAPGVRAQDIHFSQFYASPLTLNPAETGNYDGDCRVMNNYRSQWKAIGIPYLTLSLAYDRQFFIGNEHLSGGIILVHDKSGEADITVTKMYLSGAWHKNIAGHSLHGGLQAGYVMKSYTLAGLTFPNQWDRNTGQFTSTDPSLAHGETELGLGEALSYLDANAGLAWSRRFYRFEPKAGAAFFHINSPEETFFDTGSRLRPRSILYATARYDLSDRIYLQPNVMHMRTVKATDMVSGGNLGYNLGENRYKAMSVFAGALYRDALKRNNDAIVLITGIAFSRMDVGLSYDVNISGLKVVTNNKGGLEFSLIWRCKSTVPEKLAIPCDRY